MRYVTRDLAEYLADACVARAFHDPIVREFFENDHLRRLTDNFLIPTYWPMYPFLFAIARQLQPGFIVELGVEVGRGLVSMHLGCPEAEIVGVDIYDMSHNCKTSMEPVAVPGTWRLHLGDVQSFCEANPERMIDMCHMDSDHTYETTLKEWRMIRPRMRPGGVICIDDIFTEGVSRVLNEEILSASGDDAIILPMLHGVMENGIYSGTGYAAVICE